MKKMNFVFSVLFFLTLFFSVANAQEVEKKVAVLDSSMVNDMKLAIIADRLYSDGGLIQAIEKQASQEKAETGKIEKLNAVKSFVENLNKEYEKFASKFLKVDTIWVSPSEVNNKITEISQWQNSVVSDPDIKGATTLNVWEDKDKELRKLLRYKKQIK